MNPEMVTGRGVRGAIAYITHDAPAADNPKPTTAARVAWTHCLNLPTDDPELAGRIMQGTIYDAPALKELAGLSTRGRKLKEPAWHLILSWRHDESPLPPHLQSLLKNTPELRAALTKYAAIETTLSALKELGLKDHQVVLACHTDKDHLHVHAVANRVHPETGRAAKLSHSKRILNRWAEGYEVERGQIVTPNRIARREARAERQKARAEGRELPPMPPKQPKRGPGRQERTVDERHAWAEIRELQKSDTDTTEEEKRAQRVEFARLLEQLNETASAPAPTVQVPVPVDVPVRPRVPMPAVELRPAPTVQVPAPVDVPVRPRVPMPAVELRPAPTVQVPAPVDVPVRPRVPMPAVELRPAPTVQVPAPVDVPVRPRVPMPAVELRPAPTVQVPAPVDVPVRPRVPMPAVELRPAPTVQVPAPVDVPVRPRVPMPDLPGSRPPSDAPHTAAQVLAWLLDHLRRIWNREGGARTTRKRAKGQGAESAARSAEPAPPSPPPSPTPPPGPPVARPAESAADVVAAKRKQMEGLLRRSGLSDEEIRVKIDNLAGAKLGERAGEAMGVDRPALRPPTGPSREPSRRRGR